MKRSFKYILSFGMCLLSFIMFTQNMDSLKLALKNAKHDTVRCNILTLLVETESDDAIWPKYNEELMRIAEKNIAESPVQSIKTIYLKHLANALSNTGYLIDQKGDALKALEYHLKSLKIREELKDKQGIAVSFSNIGTIYYRQGDVPKALDYFHRGLIINEAIKNNVSTAIALNNLGIMYYNQHDYAKALEYYTRSLKLQEQMKNDDGIAMALNNIGGVYDMDKNYPKAIEYMQRSLKIREKLKNKKTMAVSMVNIGNVYNKINEITIAQDYLFKGLTIQEEIDDKLGMAITLNIVANSFIRSNNLNEAENYAKRCHELSSSLGYPQNIKNSASTLKEIYYKKAKYEEAFEMLKLEIKMRDSINNEQTRKASIKTQLKYEFEKKEAVIKEQQEKERIVAEEKDRFQKIVILSVVIGLLLVIIFAIFIFRSLKVTREQKHVIEEKQKEILDSIKYAKRIQTSLLPTEKYIQKQIGKEK